MHYDLVNNIEYCFVLVKDYFPVSLIYYSHITSAVIALIVGVFVFLNNRHSLASKILFAMSLTFAVWVVFNLFIWLTYSSAINIFLWSFSGILIGLLFVFCLQLAYAFINKTGIDFPRKLLLGLLFLPIIIFTPTNFNLSGFNIVDGCESVEGSYFTSYYYIFGGLIFLWIVLLAISGYRKADNEFKKQIVLFSIGIEFFILSFFSMGWLATLLGNYQIEFYGIISMSIFMGFLAYLIVKFKAFNIKLIAAQALVVALIILIGSMLFFVQGTTSLILVGVTLALSLVFGWMLVRSVKLEVERKEQLQIMSDKLAGANDQLRKLDNAKSEFISIASHQLRTPLTAIKGFISLLLEGSYGKLVPQQEDVLNKVYTSNERLVNLVEDLLNISRIESGRMEFKFDNWDMDKICQEVIDTFVLRAKDKKLDLEYIRPENPLPEIMIDGTKVREVISNLVDNAIKYTLEGHGGVRLKLEQLAENIRVTVFDSGIGIPESELPYLFAKFSRGKDTSRLNTGGTGLGLYVGKQMIENNGGRIWAESDGEGLGSRFIIEIPIQQDEELLKKWG